MITLYCSPSQSQGEFEHFLLSLENHLGNIRNKDPAFEILLGDFNARSKSWWVHDITSKEGIYINWIYQITVWFFSTNIRTKTHPPKFITLHEPHFYRPTQSCNKQQRSETITSWELSTSNHIYMPNLTCYHQPYQRLPSSIQNTLNIIDWSKLFSNGTLFNIFANFVRNKVITVDDRDPPWINEEMKCKVKSKSNICPQY